MLRLKVFNYQLRLNPKAEELKIIINELREHSAFIKSARINSDTVKKEVQIVTKRKRPGIKLIALGMGLIILPEPTGLSDIAGLPLLILGRIIEKSYSYIGIKDLREEALDALESISALSSEVIISSECSFSSH